MTELINGYWAVEVPKKFIKRKEGFWINAVNCIRFTEYNHMGKEFPQSHSSKAIPLLPGQWQIIGKGNELKEDQWKEIVEPDRLGYIDYFPKIEEEEDLIRAISYAFIKATDSGLSLLKSKNLLPETTLILRKKLNKVDAVQEKVKK